MFSALFAPHLEANQSRDKVFQIVRLKILPSLLVIAFILGGCAAGEVGLESRSINVQETAQPAGGAILTPGMATLVSQAGPSYVTLTVSKSEEKTSSGDRATKTAVTSGSGFVVENDGYIMTAAHVAVQTGNTVSARAANGRVYTGTVVNILPTNDMALIKLKGFQAGREAGRACHPSRS